MFSPFAKEAELARVITDHVNDCLDKAGGLENLDRCGSATISYVTGCDKTNATCAAWHKRQRGSFYHKGMRFGSGTFGGIWRDQVIQSRESDDPKHKFKQWEHRVRIMLDPSKGIFKEGTLQSDNPVFLPANELHLYVGVDVSEEYEYNNWRPSASMIVKAEDFVDEEYEDEDEEDDY